jgi:hypothetical protein
MPEQMHLLGHCFLQTLREYITIMMKNEENRFTKCENMI